MDASAESLVEFSTEFDLRSVSDSAVHAAKRSLVDSIGCAFGAFDAEPLAAIRRFATRRNATRPATVIGTDLTTTPELAALVNGAMIRYLDFSDDYFGGTGEFGPHPSDNIGGVLAIVESSAKGGRDLIAGTILAYEVVGRFVDGVDLEGRRRPWDYPVLHAVGSALAAANILRCTPTQTASAVGLAVVPNFSLLRTRLGELSNWKAFAGPNASRAGVFAALLAAEGITGPSEPIEGAGGLLDLLGCRPFSMSGLGQQPLRIERTYFKAIPVRYTLQLLVTQAQELRTRVNADDITGLRIHIARRFAVSRSEHGAHWDPNTRETADHSPPYLVAAALIDGAITDRTFTPERYRDPAILALADKVELVADDGYTEAFPETFKTRMEVTLASGEVISLEGTNPKGHPSNPMSDDEIGTKFLEQVSPQLGTDATLRLLRGLWALETVSDVTEIFELMRIPGKD